MDGREGWFPRLAIKELGDEEFDYSTLTKSAGKASKLGTTPEAQREVDIGTDLPPLSAAQPEEKKLPV